MSKIIQTIICNGADDRHSSPALTALRQQMDYSHPGIAYEIKQESLPDNKLKLTAVAV